jgi:plasmid rolling circle replication initiator protein Rep
MKWQARFLKALPELEKAYPKARWVFLSLTLRNCPVDELGATLDVMAQAWHRLLKRKEFRSVLGWVRALEVTKNHKNGSAHPHVHALLMVRPSYFTGAYYVTQPRWAELWAESLRIDYTPIVDVKAIKDTPEALRGAVFETLKYTLKASDLADSQEWFLTCMAQLQKRRLISSGGVLKNVLHEDKPETEKDLLLLGDGDRAEMEKWIRFDWRREVKRYQKSKRDPQG